MFQKIKEEWSKVPPYGKWLFIIGGGFMLTMLIFGSSIYEYFGWK